MIEVLRRPVDSALRPGIVVSDQLAGTDGVPGPVAFPQGDPQWCQDQRCRLGRRGVPGHDLLGVAVQDERDVHEARPRAHVGEVGYPLRVRCGRGEVPIERVISPASTRCCETQRRKVSRPTSTFGDTNATAFVTDPTSSTRSRTIRTARSLTSGSNFFGMNIILSDSKGSGITPRTLQPFTELSLMGGYENGATALAEGRGEHALPVRRLDARPWPGPTGKGIFANQNSACRLRQEFILEPSAAHFDL